MKSTKRGAWFGSKLFDTVMVFLNFVFEKVDSEEKSADDKKGITRGQRVKVTQSALVGVLLNFI